MNKVKEKINEQIKPTKTTKNNDKIGKNNKVRAVSQNSLVFLQSQVIRKMKKKVIDTK